MVAPIFIGITGGSGVGKSTLCTNLMDRHPDHIGMVQLDDYFKHSEEVIQSYGFTNWDHPDSLFLDELCNDLKQLAQGETVTINTKNERLNPDFKITRKRIPVLFEPKRIMFVEGYLVLYDRCVRDQLTTSVWLELDHETRWKRRVHFKNEGYEQKVVIPMYKKFVEPTKQYAKQVIDVSDKSKEQVLKEVDKVIDKYLRDL